MRSNNYVFGQIASLLEVQVHETKALGLPIVARFITKSAKGDLLI
jgi:hypothetical protein